MTTKDFSLYKHVFPIYKMGLDNIHTILLLSPNIKQYYLFTNLFPYSKVRISTFDDWNLDNKNNQIFDLIVAMNVFHYAKNPKIWFHNVFNSCRYFWIQDLIIRKRSFDKTNNFLGYDGDSVRYCMNPKIKSTYENAFDLSIFNHKLIDFIPYTEGDNNQSLHFIACFKGDVENNESSQSFSTFFFSNLMYSIFKFSNIFLLSVPKRVKHAFNI